MKVNGFDLNEIDNMIPWEREMYIILLDKHLEEKAKAMAKEQQ